MGFAVSRGNTTQVLKLLAAVRFLTSNTSDILFWRGSLILSPLFSSIMIVVMLIP